MDAANIAKAQSPMMQNNSGSGHRIYQIESIGTAIFGSSPTGQPIDQSDLRPGRSPGEIERTAELARLDGWRKEQGDRWAVIVGPGGAGKSTLASQWFDRSESAEPWAGRLWTDLGRGQGFAEVARRAIVHFGVASQERAERLDEAALVTDLVKALGEQPLLWVLDNLETVLELGKLPADYQAFWQQWWQQSSGAGWVLLTSRDLPAGMAERRLDLAEGFDPVQGASFLRARRIRGAEADLQAFSERVHGYPLILGLAAGFLKMEQGDDPHISKLPADFFTITAPHRDDPQATLETVLQWSFERLSPELQDWLGRLCALRVAFALETEDHPNLLPELANRSFLIQDCLPLTDPDAPRQFVYRWQPIVQQFVQRQQPDLIEAHRLAIVYHGRQYVDYGKWQTQTDIDNYIETSHHVGELARLTGDRQGEAASLGNLGVAYFSLGQFQRAIDFHEQSLAIEREIGNRKGEASSLNGLGNAYQSLGQYQRVIDFHEQSLAIQREIGHRQGEAASLGNLGAAYDSLGQYQRAIDFHEQSLAIQREIGHRQGEAASLGSLGNAYRSLGQVQRAIDFHEQHRAIAREIGDRQGEAASLGSLGNAYRSLGQYQRAIDFHEQHRAITREIGNREGEAISLWDLGDAWAKLGKIWEAKTAYESARDLFRELGLDHKVATCEELLTDLLQVIPAEIPRAPQIGEPSPNHRPRRSGSSWWVRLWRAWRRWLHRLFDRP